MVTTSVNEYWISASAINISLNAMGNPDYAQVSIGLGSTIVVYVNGVIGYDNAHKCKSWVLQGAPTAFGDSSAKYVYVAIPRSTELENQNALVVFPSELIDVYGKNENEEQIGSTNYYYIYLQGIIGPSIVEGVTVNRTFTKSIDTGKLMSDDALMNNSDSEWFSYSGVTGRVTFLKEIIMSASSKFINLVADGLTATTASIKKLVLNDTEINGVATADTPVTSTDTLLTPSAGASKFLSKTEDDIAEGDLQFKGTLDVFGNFVAKSEARFEGDVKTNANTGSGTFSTGLTGTGWRIGNSGEAEMDSLSLRKFLEVPELRYNRVSVRTGVQWQTFGGGIIEEVNPIDATTGIIKLKLEDGEVGAVEVNDKCMGIFHNETDKTANATADNDERVDGNFAFKGFMTIYFLVTEICNAEGLPYQDGDTSNHQYFKYQLRSATDTSWTDSHHPQPSMSFACYANATTASRQACIYSTTSYLNMLTGMTGWTFDGNNIALIYGHLDGFTINTKQGSTIQLTGYGIAFGNAYMWGNIKQFERAGFLVSQQAYFTSTADAPSVVTTDPNYKTHYTWSTYSVEPTPTKPYVYVYWHQTFDQGDPVDTMPSFFSTEGKEGKSAPRTLYTRSASRPSVPTAKNPSGWSTIPMSGVFDLNVSLADKGQSGCLTNYGFSKEETDNGITFKSLCAGHDDSCSWMSVTLRGKVGDVVKIPYIISSESGDYGIISTEITDDGTAPAQSLVEECEDASGTLSYTLTSESDVLYFGYVKDSSISEGSDTFSVNFGRLYSITEELDDNGDFVKWSGVVVCEGINGKDGVDGENGNDGTSPVVLQSSMSSITWPMNASNNIVSGTPNADIYLTMNIGERAVTKFSNISVTTDHNYGIDPMMIMVDYNPGLITIVPVTSDNMSGHQNNIIHITATAEGYTRKIDIPIVVVTAGTSSTGPQGIQGCVVRQSGKYDATITYYNDSLRDTPRSGEDVRFIDIVQYESGGVVNLYMRTTSNQGSYGHSPSESGYWKEANKFSFVATELLVADEAMIKYLTGQSFLVTDDASKANIVAGMQSTKNNSSAPMIFAGASQNNANTAAFRTYKDGRVVATKFQTADSGKRVEVQDGMLNIFGTGANANIRFGVDEYGNSILSYYNANGELLYDLGPDGIVYATHVEFAYYTSSAKKLFLSDTQTMPYSISFSSTGFNNVYAFHDGVKSVKTARWYSYEFSDTGWQVNHTIYNEVNFTAGSTTSPVVNIKIADGWYIEQTEPAIYGKYPNAYIINAKLYKDGLLTLSGSIYLTKNGGVYNPTYENTTAYTASGTIMDYMTETGQA